MARIRHLHHHHASWRRSGLARAGTPPVSAQTAYTDERVQPWGQDAQRNADARGAAVLVPRLHRLPTGVRHHPATPAQVRYIKGLAGQKETADLDAARSRRRWTWTTASPSPSARLATRSTRWRRLPRRRREGDRRDQSRRLPGV